MTLPTLPSPPPPPQDVTAAVRLDYAIGESGSSDGDDLAKLSILDAAPIGLPRISEARTPFLPITMLEQVPGVFCISLTGMTHCE